MIFVSCTFVRAQTVESLLEQLDSPVLRVRNEAQRKLYEMGPGVDAQLPNEKIAEEEYSSEVQIRLRNLRRAFLKDSIRDRWQKIAFRVSERSFSQEKRRLTLLLNVDWPNDQYMVLLRFMFPLNEFQLRDAKGNVLAQANRSAGVFDAPVTPAMQSAQIRVALPVEPTVLKDATFLHGRAKVLFVAAPKEFVIPLDEKAQREIRQENAVVSIRNVEIEPSEKETLLHCRVRVEYDNALEALQSHQLWIEYISATLRTSQGQIIPATAAVRQEEKTANIFEGTHMFKIPRNTDPETLEFLYTVPTVILEKTLDFQSRTKIE